MDYTSYAKFPFNNVMVIIINAEPTTQFHSAPLCSARVVSEKLISPNNKSDLLTFH